jgi:ankyrin repeat protein
LAIGLLSPPLLRIVGSDSPEAAGGKRTRRGTTPIKLPRILQTLTLCRSKRTKVEEKDLIAVFETYAVTSIHSVDENRQTLLHRAAANSDVGAVAVLIANQADVNALDASGATPLYVAIENLSLGLAETLMRHGADVTIANNDGVTPLHLCPPPPPCAAAA